MRRLEDFVPKSHPLRSIRQIANEALVKIDRLYAAMCEADVKGGRPSIAPEKLLRAMLLQVLYSIRLERQLMEQAQYNVLFRWFIGLSMDDAVWVPTVFSKKRERLIRHDAIIAFFKEVLAIAEKKHWPSGEHFMVSAMVTRADGYAEREAAKAMLEDARQALDPKIEMTVGSDKGYDAKEFVDACTAMQVVPHVAQNTSGRRSAVPDEIAASGGYAISQRKRKLIEQGFGWAKTVGRIRQMMVRGLAKVDQFFVLNMAAYNVVRMRTLGSIRPVVSA
jgi:transposase